MPEVRMISPATKQVVGNKKVAAYCRVSTNSDDQQNSYENQIRFYTKYIGEHKEWELVDIFADQGLSGTKSENRTEFQKMIQLCENHQIDLIVTKSVSRFARNVKETLAYARKLKLLGIGIQFEKEGISTLSLGDEMLLSTFAAIAQEESQSTSQHIRLSNVRRMERGEYVAGNAPYGFRLINKELVIYEPEAEVVRFIFHMYLTGHSQLQIARELTERQIPTKDGKDHWRPSKIAYILRNERYVGDSLYQKTAREKTVPFKQYRNRGQEEQFYAKGTHTGIIDRETWEKVQELLEKRSIAHARNNTSHIYPLTSRIQCSECGSFYNRRIISGTVKWVCANHLQDRHACDSSYYAEERIYDGFVAMVNKLRFSDDDILGRVIERLETAAVQYRKNSIVSRGISQSIAELNGKLLILEQLRAKGCLSEEVYNGQATELRRELTKQRKNRKLEGESKLTQVMHEVVQLKRLLWELDDPLENFDESLFTDIVKGISINNKDEMTLTVLGGLQFTELI